MTFLLDFIFTNCEDMALQVDINLLTGETTTLHTDIIYESGQSLNPAVDLG